MPDFSLLQTPNFAQAALGGYQAGRQISQQNERESALKGYLANPEDPVGITRLAGADPQLGLPLVERQRKEAENKRIGELRAKAAEGDHAAAHQLWTDDPEMASKFDERTQKLLKDANEAVGNAALRLSTLPDDQIPMAADQAIEQLSQQFPNLAQYRGHVKTRADLDRILDQTGMTEKAIELRAPKYQVSPPGGGLINTNPLSPGFDAGAHAPADQGAPVTAGAVVNGHRFKGGNYQDPANWEPVGGAGSGGPQTFQ